MVHQEVPGQGGEPGVKCPFFNVIAAHRAINPDKDLLCQVLSVVRRVGEAIAQVVNPAVIQADELLPCPGVPGQTSANKYSCLLLFQAVSPSKDTQVPGFRFKMASTDIQTMVYRKAEGGAIPTTDRKSK